MIIAVLGIGWLVGLKTQKSTILTQGFTWLGQSAITVTSKLDAWREYISPVVTLHGQKQKKDASSQTQPLSFSA